MMKILAAAAMISMAVTGASIAQEADGASGSQDNTQNSSSDTNSTEAAGQNENQPSCPPGQKLADGEANSTAAEPNCVAE